MMVPISDRRYRNARAKLGMGATEGRQVDRSEEILKLLPATYAELRSKMKDIKPTLLWETMAVLHKAKWVHISKWVRSDVSGGWMAVYFAGPGHNARRPRALYGSQAMRDLRARQRKDGRWDTVLAKRRVYYHITKLRKRSKPATPFDALF